MPTDKDFKRLVRGRMQNTGESYTAARTSLLAKPPRRAAAPRSTALDHAKLAGMSDKAIEAKTGCTWQKWVEHLDYVHAHRWTHRELAEYIHEKHKVPDWWTQAVAVGYERIKGLREIGQRRGGSFEATRSKTIAAPVERVFRAFSEARLRKVWLPGVKLTVRKATPHKSVRITWDDGTSVEVWLTAKGDAKASASVAHTKLAGREDATRRKEFWGERLEALAALLTKGK